MAFKFSLDSVLKHRRRLEDFAQKEYAEARMAVEACLQRMEQMYQRMDEVRDDIASAQNQGTREKLQEILEMETFLHGQKIRIEMLRIEARGLLVKAEEKQEALMLAAREKKVIVNLKEKRLSEYREHLRQLEIKNIDEQNMMRQNRRAR
jgi:flagellar export protein FliJ